MAKINIPFDNTNYSIEESALASATSQLKSHFQTTMNGTGATIELDGVDYNIDSAKLTNATNTFITHLGTVAGNGSKVIVGGVEYNIDSTKMANAIADIHVVLGGLHSEGDNDGDDGSLPISWNSLSVVGNPYLDMGDGTVLIKISDKTPSSEELNGSDIFVTMGDTTAIAFLQAVQVADGAVLATYICDGLDITVVSVTTTNEIAGYGIAFPEIGTYALDASQMGEIDFTLRDVTKLPVPSAPVAPTAESIYSNSIILNVIDGCEYSIDGIDWQDNPEFYGLKSETEYTFYVRYKSTATHNASESSSAVICTARITVSINSINRESIGYTDETTELIIPEFYYNDLNEPCYVVGIDANAFYECTNLTSVTIPNGVTSIGDYAFYGCSNLKSINIPNGVTSIGDTAFSGCTNLTSITIPSSVTSIDDNAFRDSGLTFVEFEQGCKIADIKYGTFFGCTNLTSVTIPNGVTSIGNYAFYDCTNLTSITIPNSVTSIGDGALEGCANLTSVTFEGTVEQWSTIEKGADWHLNVPATHVQCSDGQVAL